MANDTDANGNALTVALRSSPRNGRVAVNADGTVTYTPRNGFIGTDAFTYAVNDGFGGRATATVRVVVSPPGVDLYVVPGKRGTTTDVTFTWTFREAAYNNELAYFVVDDARGRIEGRLPGAGYAEAALKRTQDADTGAVVFQSGETAGVKRTFALPAGTLISFFLVQSSNTAALKTNNPSNQQNGSPLAFFANEAANPDRFDHFRRAFAKGLPTYSVEDLTGGGDRDFNDMIFSIASARRD